jgi:DNA repair photolyase
MSKNQKIISGTLEWAKYNANCLKNCSNNCRYCFARYNAVNRFKTSTLESWKHPVIDEKKLLKKWSKMDGTIMFPTQHDILPDFLDVCMEFIENILRPGNNILIVSKPHLECIKVICDKLTNYKNNILFRFTIGSCDNDILKYWEPGAPSFEERFESLKYAFNSGYKTSISMEPMLDYKNVIKMVNMFYPFVTDSIWIGKMNKIKQRVAINTAEDVRRVKEIEYNNTDDKIWALYNSLKDNDKIKWKENIKEVIGLEIAEEAGLDI